MGPRHDELLRAYHDGLMTGLYCGATIMWAIMATIEVWVGHW